MSNLFKRWGPATALTIAGALIGTPGYSQTVDGTRDVSYPAALAVQIIDTQYGDNSLGVQDFANGSEVDNIHAQIVGTDLFVFVGGNLQSTFNKLVLAFDSKTGGQNQLSGSTNIAGGLNGLRFDAGFVTDYLLFTTCGNSPLEVYTNYTPVGAFAGSDFTGGGPGRTQNVNFGSVVAGSGTGQVSIDNSNTAGVNGGTGATAGTPSAVSQGIEFRIPLAALGATVGGGDIKITAFIADGGPSNLSNQVLGGLPAGTGNLGGAGGVNFNTIAGPQFVTVANGVVVITAPDIALSPTSLNFFNVGVAAPAATLTVDVINNGNALLMVTNVTSSNPRFSVSSAPFVVAPGGTHPVVVSFDPLAAVSSTGTIRFFSNDPVTPQATLAVSGNGVATGMVIVDGTLDALYGPALALQNNTTGFGDNLSELDGAYARIIGDRLYLLFTGNLETGGNRIVLFLDNSPKFHNSSFSAAAWPSIGNSDNLNNLIFEPSFSPEYMISLNTSGGQTFADFAEIGTANSFFLGSAGPNSQALTFPGGGTGQLAVKNTNAAGVNGTPNVALGNPGAVTTGFEFVIPLAEIAPGYSAATPLRLMAFISNNDYNFLSNQVLGGIGGGSPTANVVNIGAPAFQAFGDDFGAFPGTQFVTLQRGDETALDGEFVDLKGDFRNVTVETGGYLTAYGALGVNGGLLVKSGGDLDLSRDATTMVGTGNFALQGTGQIQLQNPAGLTTSGATGAVRNTGSRAFSPFASYSYTTDGTPGVTGNALPATVRELILKASLSRGTLSSGAVTLSQNVAVTEAVRCQQADLILDGHILRLTSDLTTGTALIENDGGAVIGNTGHMDCVLDPTFRSIGYRHYSAPVSGMNVGQLTANGFTPIVDPAYNSLTPPTYTWATFPNVFFFDETKATTDFVAGYQSPASLTSPLNVGAGYAVRLSSLPELSFKGSFTTDDQDVTLTRTGNDPNNSGWSLIGNPFPSPMDWDDVTIPAGMSGQVSVLTPVASPSGNGGVYLTRIGGIGTLPIGWVPAAQGMFVRRTAPGSGTFTLEQSARMTTLAGPTIHYRAAPDARPVVRLAVEGTGTLEGVADVAIVYFQDGATAAQDDRFDATRVAASLGDVPTLSTRLADGTLAQIDGRPLLTRDVEVPLAVSVTVTGTYVLNAREIRNFAGDQPVLLVDALTNTVQDLRTTPTYRCTLTAGAAAPRFSLRFGAGEAAHTVASALLSVYPNPSTGTVAVEWAGNEPLIGTVTLTDLLGRVVRERPAGGMRLTLANLPKGVYSLRVLSTEGPLTRRIVVE